MSERYCLRWNNHQSNMINIFHALLKKEAFTDVTLAVENHTIKCHKLILAACSPYLQKLLEESPCKHPTIILKDIKYADLKIVLDFMYNGEVNIIQEQFSSLLKTAEALQVRGLVSLDDRGDLQRSEARDMSPTPTLSSFISSTNRDIAMASSSSGPSSPPHSTYDIHKQREFSRPPMDHWSTSIPPSSNQTYQHISPTPSLLHHARITGLSNSYDNEDLHLSSRMKRDTPILRTALGQGVSNSQTILPSSDPYEVVIPPYRLPTSINSICRGIDLSQCSHSRSLSPFMEDEEEKKSPKQKETKSDPPKPEWKRYKQYSRAEIESAISAVKEGMSAVQAARKFNVPSRTLYDKVKKLGITRIKRSSSTNSNNSANTAYDADDSLNGNVYMTADHVPIPEAENENDGAACNVKKIRQDHHEAAPTLDSSTRCVRVTSPVIHYANQMQQLSIEDERNMETELCTVQDLSMSRLKYIDQSALLAEPRPSTPDEIKKETRDADLSSDNDQN